MRRIPRQTTRGAAAVLATLVVACCAWLFATLPLAQPRFGKAGDLPQWRTDAPAHQIRPPSQTIVARQASPAANVLPGSPGAAALPATGAAPPDDRPGEPCRTPAATCGPTPAPDAAWPRGPPA